MTAILRLLPIFVFQKCPFPSVVIGGQNTNLKYIFCKRIKAKMKEKKVPSVAPKFKYNTFIILIITLSGVTNSGYVFLASSTGPAVIE